jgi:Na+/serine symporter
MIINMIPNIKLIKYKFKEQLYDILPSLGLSALMAGAIYPIHFIELPAATTLCLQVLSGILVYIILSILFKAKSFYFIIDTLRQFRNRKKD